MEDYKERASHESQNEVSQDLRIKVEDGKIVSLSTL